MTLNFLKERSDEMANEHGESEYEVVDSVKIDVSLIPDHVRDEFAAATLEFVRNIIRQPEGQEKIAAKSAALKGACL